MTRPLKKLWNAGQDPRVVDLYLEAMELPSDERASFVRSRAGDDADLAKQVEALLGQERLQGFLEKPAIEDAFSTARASQSIISLEENETLGDYVILKEIGAGAFATVFLAQQRSLGREVALKVSPSKGEEARILAHLDHDHIVKVFAESVERGGSIKAIAMQYIAGATLEEVLEALQTVFPENLSGATILEAVRRVHTRKVPGRRPRSGEGPSPLEALDFPAAVLWIGSRIANALDYAHAKGVLHLDVKPSNILLDEHGRPYLSDFNVSLDLGAKGGRTSTVLGGTLNYMAPEQWNAVHGTPAKIDHRADIFSLGIVLREFLALKATRSSGSRTILRRHTGVLKDFHREIETTIHAHDWRALDTNLRILLNKCTAQLPENRFQSAARLSEAMQSGVELRAVLKSLPQPGGALQWAQRRPIAAVSLSLAAAPLFFSMVVSVLIVPRLLDFPTLAPWALLGPAAGLAAVAWMLLEWWWAADSIRHALASPLDAFGGDSARSLAREKILELPTFLQSALTTLWLPSMLAPLGVAYLEGTSIPDVLLGEVLVLASAAGLLAMGYGALLCQYVALRVLYPKVCLGNTDLSRTLADDLLPLPSRLRIFYAAITTLPLVCSILALTSPTLGAERNTAVILLLGLGLSGVIFSLYFSNRFNEIIFAYTGRSRAQ